MMRSHGFYFLNGCLALVLAVSNVGCTPDGSEPASSVSGDASLATPGGGETVTITEAELHDAMANDTLAKFAGKQLELHGLVQAIGADGGGHLLLEETRVNMVDAQPWAKVLPGQKATLIGTYTEERGLKFDVKSVEGERPVMTAVELCRTFVADKEATNEKYKEKYLDVTGTISEVKVGDADIMQVSVQGDGDNFVVCSFFPEGQQAELASLKVGDTIRFVGAYTRQVSFDTPVMNFCLLLNTK